MAVAVFAIVEFWLVPPGNTTLDLLSLSAIGFLIYGPQLLVGVHAATVVPKAFAGTATGFTGLWGYLCSIVSGIGVGWIVDHYGWNGGFSFLIGCCGIGGVLFLFTLRSSLVAKHHG